MSRDVPLHRRHRHRRHRHDLARQDENHHTMLQLVHRQSKQQHRLFMGAVRVAGAALTVTAHTLALVAIGYTAVACLSDALNVTGFLVLYALIAVFVGAAHALRFVRLRDHAPPDVPSVA